MATYTYDTLGNTAPNSEGGTIGEGDTFLITGTSTTFVTMGDGIGTWNESTPQDDIVTANFFSAKFVNLVGGNDTVSLTNSSLSEGVAGGGR